MPTITEMVQENAPEIKKLALLVPMRGKIDCIFLQSYLALFIHLLKKKGIVAQPVFSDAMPLDKARCQLVKSAILNKADYALWMDADVVMTENMFERLWETLHTDDEEGNERHIVSGVYYEREIPYDAVIRARNELGLYEKIMQFPEDEPFKVDGIGFGFVLMKMQPLRDAFASTKGFPFRWTQKVSEDLYFCDIIGGVGDVPMVDKDGKPIKYTIWVDPRVQVPHYGSYTTQWHYLHYKLDEYHDIQELKRYLKEDAEVVYQKCMHGALNMCKAWQDKFGKDKDEKDLPEEDVLDFYRNTDLYLYDLTWHWSHNRQGRESVMNAITDRTRGDKIKVLDFGCGIGDYGLQIAQNNPDAKVYFYDINIHNIEYLKSRIALREVQNLIPKGNCVILDKLPEKPEEFDVVLALDVLEHIKEPRDVANNLHHVLKRNGVLLGIVSPKGSFQPQHISELDLNTCGFLQTDVYTYVRMDSDLASSYASKVDKLKTNMHRKNLKDTREP
jgi:2-polyprenyl-3-methyl-5-hydroxy-6-metoxy-1,4-benzoquinol methylase